LAGGIGLFGLTRKYFNARKKVVRFQHYQQLQTEICIARDRQSEQAGT
jgi:hypothetical protein